MRSSTLYVTTLAFLLGCGGPVELAPEKSQGGQAQGVAAAAAEEEAPGSYNFNPGPLPDLRPPDREDGGGGGGGGGGEDPNLQLSERGLVFSQTCPGDTSTKSLTLTNNGGATLRVSNLAVSGSGYSLSNVPSLPANIQPGRNIAVRVRFTPGASSLTPFDGTLRITSNDPGNPTTNVLLSGLSLPTTFTANPRTVSFGSLDDGESRSRAFTVTNSGSCPGRIRSVRVTGSLNDNISTGPLPPTIDPGDSTAITVRFTCNGEDDNLSATMRLLDGSSRSLGAVQLTGSCSN